MIPMIYEGKCAFCTLSLSPAFLVHFFVFLVSLALQSQQMFGQDLRYE